MNEAAQLRRRRASTDVACRWCAVAAGEPCREPTGAAAILPHRVRWVDSVNAEHQAARSK